MSMARFKSSSHFQCIFLYTMLITMSHCYSQQEQITGFALKMIPWDSPRSYLYQQNLTQTQKIQMMAMSSRQLGTKTNHLVPKILSGNGTNMYPSYLPVPFTRQYLRYSVVFKLGNPSTDVQLLLDTGSGPIWTKCAKSDSNFNPSNSKSYRSLSCDHPFCNKHWCRCIQEKCLCTQYYGTNYHNMHKAIVVLSSDAITLPFRKGGSRTYTNIIFGCASEAGLFSGVLGINKLPLSLIGQLKDKVKGRYSYCLHDGDGHLHFGDDIPRPKHNPFRKKAKTTPLLYPRDETMHLNLKDISVANKKLGLSPADFSYQQGGFSIDTGSSFTILRKPIYDKVINAFRNYYNKLKVEWVDGKPYLLDLCYKSKSIHNVKGSMTFHFEGADYKTRNLFVIPKVGVICLGLVSGDISLLGALQQRHIRFIFDINANRLTFVPDDCSS